MNGDCINPGHDEGWLRPTECAKFRRFVSQKATGIARRTFRFGHVPTHPIPA